MSGDAWNGVTNNNFPKLALTQYVHSLTTLLLYLKGGVPTSMIFPEMAGSRAA